MKRSNKPGDFNGLLSGALLFGNGAILQLAYIYDPYWYTALVVSVPVMLFVMSKNSNKIFNN